MAMLDEVRAKFSARLRQTIHSKHKGPFDPTREIPGSEGKIKVLAERLAGALESGREFNLHHPDDAKMPLGMAWRIWVGPNGRIVKKQLVQQDQAGLFVVTDEPSVVDQVKEMVGERWQPVRPAAQNGVCA
jgi:hypothetical protein